MYYRIAMLLKPELIEYCESQILENREDIKLSYFSYTTMEEFELLSRKICEDFDGIITSGVLPDTVLSQKEYAKSICRSYFGFDIENVYRLILSELLLQPHLKLDQIGCDLLFEQCTLPDVILHNRMYPLAMSMWERMIKTVSYEEMVQGERQLADAYIQLFRKNEIAFALTCSLYVTEILKKEGYPCGYIFPSASTIQHVIEEICRAVDLKRARGIAPAVIRIDLHNIRPEENSFDRAQYIIALGKALSEFAQSECGELTLKNGADNFELYTEQSILSRLTEEYRSCPLSAFLDPVLYESVSVGYGLGAGFYQARTNAVNACSYSHNCKDGQAVSFLIDEAGRLTGLTGRSDKEARRPIALPADYIEKTALQVKLSTNTLLKILGILKAEGTNEISSTEIVNRLGVSLRTANRYLSNLEKYGKATIVGRKKHSGTGPNINIYKIDLLY